MRIKVFTTGGSIDKVYSEGKGVLNFSFGIPAIMEIGKGKIHLNLYYDIEKLIEKDSLHISIAERNLIKQACEKTPFDKILITHGTDTMISTAASLCTIRGKAIVLTGASQPYRFRESDAEFNIGVAIGALNVIDDGVFIAMNGRVYEWNKCKKLDDGRFIEIPRLN